MDEDITVYSRNLNNTLKIVSVFILFFLPPMYESSLWGMNIKPPWRDWPYIDP
jgi:Mg2+ and Co2+ transporter CorA